MTTIVDNEAFSFAKLASENVLLLTWKHVPGLEVAIFRKCILDFAGQCETHRPSRAIIDATKLDQASPAVAWLRGQESTENEAYSVWWLREIVPKYNASEIPSLAVATGDPSAPGEQSGLPEFVDFKVGYFSDLETSMTWRP